MLSTDRVIIAKASRIEDVVVGCRVSIRSFASSHVAFSNETYMQRFLK